MNYPQININQNVIVLILSVIGLGASEFYNLKTLYWLSLPMAIIMGVSVCLSMVYYTYDYILKKRG